MCTAKDRPKAVTVLRYTVFTLRFEITSMPRYH